MTVSSRLLGFLLAVVGRVATVARPAAVYARPPEPPTATQRWLLDRVKDKGLLVIHVLVPLCDNAQIVCGSQAASDPDDLKHNLYWGAVFGQKRFFTRKASNFEGFSFMSPSRSTRASSSLSFARSQQEMGNREASGLASGRARLGRMCRPRQRPELRVLINADRNVPHGVVMRVMDLLKQGGAARIAYAAERAPRA